VTSRPIRSMPSRHAGQAATETLVAALAIAAALCVPWLDGESPASLLLGVLIGASRAFQHWIFLV
jgi:hypothetical protein